MDINDVIIKPVLSEKSTEMRKKHNKYCFKVNKDATKNDIIKAFEILFKVHVIKCNIMNVSGKLKRRRYNYGYTPSWKKAIVTLRKEDIIEAFKGI